MHASCGGKTDVWRKPEEGTAAKAKLKEILKELILLIGSFSYLYTADTDHREGARWPRALRFYPLWAGICGGILSLGAWVLYPGSFRVSALALLGLDLVLGGLFMLRQLMWFADGRCPEAAASDSASWLPYSVPGITMGLLWLLLLYAAYYSLLRKAEFAVFFLALVFSRWLFCWLVWAWPARRPGTLHQGFRLSHFLLSSLLSLIFLLPWASMPLLWSVSLAALAALLLAVMRCRYVGALDELCYAAAVAWGQVIFLCAWLAAVSYQKWLLH